MAELTEQRAIRDALARARVVAVLGAHIDPARPAHYVPEYLYGQRYRIIPVNPRYAGRTLWGEPVRQTLAELDVAIDLVDVFRRSERVADHTRDILAMRPRPSVIWLQRGIRNDAFARAMTEAGMDVVQDRCTLADHQRFGIGSVAAPGDPA